MSCNTLWRCQLTIHSADVCPVQIAEVTCTYVYDNAWTWAWRRVPLFIGGTSRNTTPLGKSDRIACSFSLFEFLFSCQDERCPPPRKFYTSTIRELRYIYFGNLTELWCIISYTHKNIMQYENIWFRRKNSLERDICEYITYLLYLKLSLCNFFFVIKFFIINIH